MDQYFIIIQARMGSTRRPGKINNLFNGEPMVVYQIKRLQSYGYKNIVVATTNEASDDITEEIVNSTGAICFRGSKNDVLNRFYECCNKYKIENIIRVGGDDPLIDPEGIMKLCNIHKTTHNDYDLIYTSHPKGWIYGTAAEFFTYKSISIANKTVETEIEREHIIPYYKNNYNKLKILKVDSLDKYNRKDIYVSVDYQEDLDLIAQIIDFFTQKGTRYTFTQKELITLYDSGKLNINNKQLHSGF